MPVISPVNDLAFKKLLGSLDHPDVTRGFIDDWAGFAGRAGAVRITDPYDIRIAENFNRNAVTDEELDRLATTLRDVTVDVEFADMVAEVQLSKQQPFAARALYYACGRFVSHYHPVTGYMGLRPVHGVNLVGFTMFDCPNGFHRFNLADEVNGDGHDLGLFKIGFIEFHKTRFQTEHQALWCEFFRTGKAPAGAPAYIEEAASIVDYWQMTRKERDMIDVMEKARADTAAPLRTAYSDGRTDGLAEGKAEGLAEGLGRGIAAAMVRGESDEVIAQWSGLPVEEIARLRAGR
jgi:predicted transposase/invertase (TIGR01784 family)